MEERDSTGTYFVHRTKSHIISSFFLVQLVNVLDFNWNIFGQTSDEKNKRKQTIFYDNK